VNHTAPASSDKTPAIPSQTSDEVLQIDIDVDSISTVPSVKEYKKLRNVMSMITKFYRDGSEKKGENFRTMEFEISKLDDDKKMCSEQLSALDEKPLFRGHPKSKEYRKNLQDELTALETQRVSFVEKREEFHSLYQWSKQIVQICEWLELNMDDYCKKHMKDLPPSLFKDVQVVPQLTEEQVKIYRKGLGEITYNLDESQDFFQASIDGRLNKYHNIERQLIEAQLRVISNYPQDNPRRIHVQTELEKDLQYVKGNLVESPEGNKRRQKMLKNHQEFFKVLVYHKDKLGALGEDIEEKKYDPKYDHYNDVE